MVRLVPLAVLAAGLAAFFGFGLQRYVTFETLARHREVLLAWVAGHSVLAPLGYIIAYILLAAFSLPGGAILTMTGGFLLGTVIGTLCTLVGATLGAIAVFLAARTAFGDLLRAKAGSALQRMEEGFRRDAFSYLLVLRLVPLFPFFLVNLVPAFLGVPLRTYIAATVIGIIPATFVFASVGNGLGAVLDAGDQPNVAGLLLNRSILLPILGLAVLALIPAVYRRVKERQGAGGRDG